MWTDFWGGDRELTFSRMSYIQSKGHELTVQTSYDFIPCRQLMISFHTCVFQDFNTFLVCQLFGKVVSYNLMVNPIYQGSLLLYTTHPGRLLVEVLQLQLHILSSVPTSVTVTTPRGHDIPYYMGKGGPIITSYPDHILAHALSLTTETCKLSLQTQLWFTWSLWWFDGNGPRDLCV